MSTFGAFITRGRLLSRLVSLALGGLALSLALTVGSSPAHATNTHIQRGGQLNHAPRQSATATLQVVSQIQSSYPNFTQLEADCPSGYLAAGGGAEALGGSSILNASIPNGSDTGWIAVGHQPSFNSVGLHVFAVCLV